MQGADKMSVWNFQDLTGMKFGRLTVLERAENKGGKTYWRCRCECGEEVTVYSHSLKSGATKSCGCLGGGKLKDLTGQKFGRLTVLERTGSDERKNATWRCRCTCGNECIVTGHRLKSGETKSCGCWIYEFCKTHGKSKTKLYQTWADMKGRCLNKNNVQFPNYGGRGISVFSEWLNDFNAFFDYVSNLPHFGEKGYTLDRINNNGNYEPGNLRWADVKTQNRNTRQNRIVEYEGKMMPLAEAAEKAGLPDHVLRGRIKRGEPVEILFRPVEKKGGYKNVKKHREITKNSAAQFIKRHKDKSGSSSSRRGTG